MTSRGRNLCSSRPGIPGKGRGERPPDRCSLICAHTGWRVRQERVVLGHVGDGQSAKWVRAKLLFLLQCLTPG